MTLDNIIKELRARPLSESDLQLVEKAIVAVRRRQELEHFNDEKNIYELNFAVDYALNPPEKTGRKND